MKAVYSAAASRQLDQQWINDFGMPSHTLMEVAGKGAAELLQQQYPQGRIAILCGSGNNGGDGYVMARWLHIWGREVTLFSLSSPKTEDAKRNATFCTKLQVPCHATFTTNGFDIFVDAMLGTGQNRSPGPLYLQAIQTLQKYKKGIIISLDVPTGIHPDTGWPFSEQAIFPHHVFCFGFWKKGLLHGHYRCPVDVIDIGLSGLSIQTASPQLEAAHFLLEKSDIQSYWPAEAPHVAKWNRGHVAIMGGGGAAVLAAHAALQGGAGLVSILMPKAQWSHLHGLRPEIILSEEDKLDPRRHDCLVIGPGLGLHRGDLVIDLWKTFPNPMVVDADAISIIAQHSLEASAYPRVLTPHIAEAARLLQSTTEDILEDPWLHLNNLQRWGFTLLKGPYTKLGTNPTLINPRGNQQLATAGSGDILTGMIAAMLSKNIPIQKACAIAVFWHGLAGEQLRLHDGASDLLIALREVLPDLLT